MTEKRMAPDWTPPEMRGLPLNWSGSETGDSCTFEVVNQHDGRRVTLWAGGELDPMYLTPDEARKAADEWPAILRDMADRAEVQR